jgi:hypothetical protein
MAEDDAQRATAKRQIARLIGGAALPVYVLSESGHIVFANEALGQLVGCDPDALIGWDCSSILPVCPELIARQAAWLSVPAEAWNLQVHVHSLGPFPTRPHPTRPVTTGPIPAGGPSVAGRSDAEGGILGGNDSVAEGTSWVRVCIPLEAAPQPTLLCFLKVDAGDVQALSQIESQSRVLRSFQEVYPLLTDDTRLWFLRGESVGLDRTRAQLQAAISGTGRVHVRGLPSTPRLEIAETIAFRRESANPASPRPRGETVTVECRLMDRDLLKSMLEVIEEKHARISHTPSKCHVILHGLDELAAELIPYLAHSPALQASSVIATSAVADLALLHARDPDWQSFAGTLDAHVVNLIPLRDRAADIEILISSWIHAHASDGNSKIRWRWSREFLDAMTAYPWPGDFAEFSEALRESIASSSDGLLTAQNLPRSIRTFPSQTRRPVADAGIELDATLEGIERQLIQRALERCPRNRAAAAKLLGISRARLLRRLEQWGLENSKGTEAREEDVPVFEEIVEDPADPSSAN